MAFGIAGRAADDLPYRADLDGGKTKTGIWEMADAHSHIGTLRDYICGPARTP